MGKRVTNSDRESLEREDEKQDFELGFGNSGDIFQVEQGQSGSRLKDASSLVCNPDTVFLTLASLPSVGQKPALSTLPWLLATCYGLFQSTGQSWRALLGASWCTTELREQSLIPNKGESTKRGGETVALLRESGETDCIRGWVSFLQESKQKKESKTFFSSLMSTHPILPPLSRIGVFWSCYQSSYQIVRSL